MKDKISYAPFVQQKFVSQVVVRLLFLMINQILL